MTGLRGAAKCTLIVFIDDATGALMQCHFAPSETIEAYMNTFNLPRQQTSNRASIKLDAVRVLIAV